jgi:hypothetical protein
MEPLTLTTPLLKETGVSGLPVPLLALLYTGLAAAAVGKAMDRVPIRMLDKVVMEAVAQVVIVGQVRQVQQTQAAAAVAPITASTPVVPQQVVLAGQAL